MINILSILGFGDSLITAMTLELLESNMTTEKIDFRVVGNKNTVAVWKILGFNTVANVTIFEDVPAFYNFSESKLIDVFRDLCRFRLFLKTLPNKDTLFFERPSDIRSNLLVKGLPLYSVYVSQKSNAYLDRAKVLGDIFSQKITFPGICNIKITAKSLLINPSARQRSRVLDFDTIRFVIEIALTFNIKVTLLDFYGELSFFEKKVTCYVFRPDLDQSIKLLKESDRYIGPDSFFVHLAYYFRVPQLAFFRRNWTYFTPPDLLDNGGVYYFEDIPDRDLLKSKIINLLT
jgi:hypothetical protein